MGGLAIGSWIAGTRTRRSSAASLRTYAALELLIAACALLLPVAVRTIEPVLAWAYLDGDAPVRFAVVRVVISLLAVGMPAAAMGATFPIAVDWSSRTPSDAGVLYAANTAGAAAGAASTGFWLIPAIGIRGATLAGVALNGAAALGAMWLAARREDAAAGPA